MPLVNVVLTNPYRVKITGVTLNVGYSTYLNVTYYSGSTRLGLFVHDNTNKFIKFADKDYEIELYREEFADADGVRL
mgnify:CR=1 FL=1